MSNAPATPYDARPDARTLWVAIPMVLAALLLPVVPGAPASEAEPPAADTRLTLWVDTASGPHPVADGASLSAGDRVLVGVRDAPAPWVTLAVSGPDGVDVYGSWKVTSDDQPAPFALGLSETGPQRVHAVFTDARPSDDRVRAAISEPPPADVHVDTVAVDVR